MISPAVRPHPASHKPTQPAEKQTVKRAVSQKNNRNNEIGPSGPESAQKTGSSVEARRQRSSERKQEARQTQEERSAERAIAEQRVERHRAEANIAVVRSRDEQVGTLIDTFA